MPPVNTQRSGGPSRCQPPPHSTSRQTNFPSRRITTTHHNHLKMKNTNNPTKPTRFHPQPYLLNHFLTRLSRQPQSASHPTYSPQHYPTKYVILEFLFAVLLLATAASTPRLPHTGIRSGIPEVVSPVLSWPHVGIIYHPHYRPLPSVRSISFNSF